MTYSEAVKAWASGRKVLFALPIWASKGRLGQWAFDSELCGLVAMGVSVSIGQPVGVQDLVYWSE